jgi:hypothetical protein
MATIEPWLLRRAFLAGIKPCDVIMHYVYWEPVNEQISCECSEYNSSTRSHPSEEENHGPLVELRLLFIAQTSDKELKLTFKWMQMNYILLLSPQELWEYSDKLHLWRQLEYMLYSICSKSFSNDRVYPVCYEISFIFNWVYPGYSEITKQTPVWVWFQDPFSSPGY